jgi:hypothetical protein
MMLMGTVSGKADVITTGEYVLVGPISDPIQVLFGVSFATTNLPPFDFNDVRTQNLTVTAFAGVSDNISSIFLSTFISNCIFPGCTRDLGTNSAKYLTISDSSRILDVTVGSSNPDWGTAQLTYILPGNVTGISLVHIASVPEPSTWVMIILGFLGLGIPSRRRKNQAATMRAA